MKTSSHEVIGKELARIMHVLPEGANVSVRDGTTIHNYRKEGGKMVRYESHSPEWIDATREEFEPPYRDPLTGSQVRYAG